MEELLKEILNENISFKKEILKELKALKETNEKSALWGITKICDYFDMQRTTVSEKIISHPNFPKPFSVENTHPRWISDEVKKFAARHRVN